MLMSILSTNPYSLKLLCEIILSSAFYVYPHNLLLQSYQMNFKSGETFSELARPLSKIFHKWQDGTQARDTCILSEGSQLRSLYRGVSKKV